MIPLKSLRWLAPVMLAFFSIGCGSFGGSKPDYKVTIARFHIEAAPIEQGMPIKLPISEVSLYMLTKPVITEGDITGVHMVKTDMGNAVLFELTSDAARDLYRITGTNQGRRIVVTINGIPLGVRKIDAPYNQGVIVMYLEVAPEDIEELVKNLNDTSVDVQKRLAKE